MFNGLIREFGEVVKFEDEKLSIKSNLEPKIGDSIAVNGACLTVVELNNSIFSVELSKESQKLIATENLKGRVHLESAMMLKDKIDGHIVQGHIDTVGKILQIKKNSNSYDIYIDIEAKFLKFIIPKGSIAIDGVSLTVNEVFKDSFRVTIIPHTFENTLFLNYDIGRYVNIETDMFARYIYHIFKRENSLSWSEVESIMARY